VARDGERSASLEFVRDLRTQTIFPFPTLPVNREAVRLTQDLTGVPVEIVSDLKPEIKPTYDDGVRPISMPNPMPSFSETFTGSIETASSKIARLSTQPLITRRSAAIRTTTSPLMATTVTSLPVVANKTGLPLQSVALQAVAMPAVTMPVPTSRPLVPPVVEHSSLDRTPSRFGMIAAILTSVALLLGLVFGFSPRRTDASASTATDTSSSAAVSHTAEPTRRSAAAPATQPAKRPLQTTAAKAAAKPAAKATARPAVTKAPVATITAATPAAKAQPSKSALTPGSAHSRGDTLIARDTVVYLEKPAKKMTATKPAPLRARPRAHRNGEVAENTVTYRNGMTGPSATAAKPAK
jgi:hypothetical protein